MSKQININNSDYNEILRQAVAALPLEYNLLLISELQSFEGVIFYANEVFKNSCNLGFLGEIIQNKRSRIDYE